MRLSVKLVAAFIVVITLASASVFATSLTASNSMIDTSSEKSKAALEEEVGLGIKTLAIEIRDSIDEIMANQYRMVQSWAKSPTLVKTAELAQSYSLQELYDAWSDPATRQFDDREAVGDGDYSNDIYPDASLYLIQLQQATKISGEVVYPEIFFTDDRGYAIAASAATGDFDQGPDDWRVFQYPNGTEYYTKHGPAPGGEGWYRDANAASDGLFAGEVEWDNSAETWGIDICVVIANATTGTRVGTMKAVFDYGAFIGTIVGTEELDVDEMKIVDQNGIIVASSEADTTKVNNPDIDMLSLESVSAALATGDPGTTLEVEEDGEEVLTGWAVSDDENEHIVLVSRNAEEVFQSVQELEGDIESLGYSQMLQIALVSVIATMVVVVIGVLIARSITSPIVQLTGIAKKVKDGDLDVSAKVKGPDEVQEFSETFDDMIVGIKMLLETEGGAKQLE